MVLKKMVYGTAQRKTSDIFINIGLFRIKEMCTNFESDIKISEAGDMMNY